MNLIHGDCLEVLPTLDESSFDTCITDPPYGLEFMGKGWDGQVPGVAYWKEVLRVLKPGAMLLAFGGTRTYHRLAVAIEDAGFEIRDSIAWLYGSGFPKSHNIGKGIDAKILRGGSDSRRMKETNEKDREFLQKRTGNSRNNGIMGKDIQGRPDITAPATEAAQLWDGWGTALKPAHEPIIVAMKPREGTFAQNALRWGVAGINVDGSRIGTEEISAHGGGKSGNRIYGMGEGMPAIEAGSNPHKGRWPANVILDEEAAELLDEQTGVRPSSYRKNGSTRMIEQGKEHLVGIGRSRGPILYSDSGGPSRFFYTAKSSKRERNAGLEGMEEKIVNDGRETSIDNAYQRGDTLRQNSHPTVKPLSLMRYLCKLTATPTGGTVLDPFMGSGTTGVASVMEGRGFVGIEKNKEYMEISERRISWAQKQDVQLELSV